jgi:hypothetical protein
MILTTQLGTDRKAIHCINYIYAGALRVENFRYKNKFHWIYSAILFATPLSGSVSVFLFPCPNEFGRRCIRQTDRKKQKHRGDRLNCLKQHKI